MEFKINDHERSALRGLPYIQRMLYVFALRPFMDFSTGIVGVERKVSYQSLSEELYIDPHPGIKSGSPSKQQIQRALEALERVGLIQRHPQNSLSRGLILLCSLASSDSFIQNKVDAKPIRKRDSKASCEKYYKTVSYNDNSPLADSADLLKADIPPVSGNINTLSQEKLSNSFISEGFQPSPSIIEKAKKYDCPTATCRDELAKFISFHQSKGNRRCNWNAEYLGWLLRAKQYQQERKYAPQQSSGKRRTVNNNLSAIDRVFKANEELIRSKSPTCDGRVVEHYG